jgi:hypothetical protein
MDKSTRSNNNNTNINLINHNNNNQNHLKSNKNIIKAKRISSSLSNISLDQYQFENKTKKGNKFGLLEFKRLNEIQNFDICNCKKKIKYKIK